MRYSSNDLRAAADAGVISADQLASLLAFLGSRPSAPADQPRAFDMVHVLWYAGALIVMSAMGLFSTLAFSAMGGVALTITALVYAVLFAAGGHYLWHTKGLRTPGGLLIAIAVSMAPLAVFGIQEAYGFFEDMSKRTATVRGFYHYINGSWIYMEMAAVAAAALALRFYRFPFLVLIIAFALWFFSMDLAPLLGKKPFDFEVQRQVSIWFGLAIIIAAMIVNVRQRSGDYAFWLYLFGVLTFWGGITAASDGTALAKALYCAMNVGFLAIAVFLGRQVFAVFGTLGIAIYLGDLANNVFQDSLLFPFALSLIGVAVIGLGLFYHRRQAAIRRWLDDRLPPALQKLRPANAIE
ncbi:MAG TPA: hypothetical protein VNZ94_13815 [Xanthobacteraceae bacterium]|nr:hypothetical protein [Xanthobacteraceae bacterium]